MKKKINLGKGVEDYGDAISYMVINISKTQNSALHMVGTQSILDG